MKRRKIEVFVAGCDFCDNTIKVVEELACPSCEVEIINMQTDKNAWSRAANYGISCVPTVVVNGKIADCCRQGAIDKKSLQSMGVGSPL